MATVAVLATLDTKGAESVWLRAHIEALGCDVHLIDVGVHDHDQNNCETSRFDVAAAAGESIESLIAADDRGRALAAMGRGAAVVVSALQRAGAIDAVLAVGGSGGSSIAAAAMQALPLGFPKLLVSTMASGDVAPYIGESDICLMYSVVDIAGINRISRMVLGNAVAAVTGMARDYAVSRPDDPSDSAPLIGASMFGVTTPAVDACRKRLERAGYEVLVFHATGSGGRTLEKLTAEGLLDGVLDLTTTELADELVGGVLSAGPDRVTAAGKAGVPQVVSVGALDMVNFGAADSVPAVFRDRQLYEHNPTVTLMRTTADECEQLGAALGRKLAAATGPTALVLPLRGLSALDHEGGLFADQHADAALSTALRRELTGTDVEVIDFDGHINDDAFAALASETLLRLLDQKETQNS